MRFDYPEESASNVYTKVASQLGRRYIPNEKRVQVTKGGS